MKDTKCKYRLWCKENWRIFVSIEIVEIIVEINIEHLLCTKIQHDVDRLTDHNWAEYIYIHWIATKSQYEQFHDDQSR